jgi:8-oxo-dGTP pyrophosphatase MutT (NUDIX family)
MTRYVMGFCFGIDMKEVVMIKKNRPTWQAGLWNGVGGHVEEGEDSGEAMKREFEQETGVAAARQGPWRLVSTIGNENYQVEVFASASNAIFEVSTITDEEVSLWSVSGLLESTEATVYNVPWLMLMAREMLQGRDHSAHYRIQH